MNVKFYNRINQELRIHISHIQRASKKVNVPSPSQWMVQERVLTLNLNLSLVTMPFIVVPSSQWPSCAHVILGTYCDLTIYATEQLYKSFELDHTYNIQTSDICSVRQKYMSLSEFFFSRGLLFIWNAHFYIPIQEFSLSLSIVILLSSPLKLN